MRTSSSARMPVVRNWSPPTTQKNPSKSSGRSPMLSPASFSEAR
jgi:hypothetical protein